MTIARMKRKINQGIEILLPFSLKINIVTRAKGMIHRARVSLILDDEGDVCQESDDRMEEGLSAAELAEAVSVYDGNKTIYFVHIVRVVGKDRRLVEGDIAASRDDDFPPLNADADGKE